MTEKKPNEWNESCKLLKWKSAEGWTKTSITWLEEAFFDEIGWDFL